MNLGENLGRLCRATTRLLNRKIAEQTDRSVLQLRALQAIERENVHTQVALAERLMIDAPSTSRLVDRLEEEGLLKRCEGADRRCVHLTVTSAAASELKAIEFGFKAVDAEVRRHLSAAEVKTLQQLLAKLEAGLAAVERE